MSSEERFERFAQSLLRADRWRKFLADSGVTVSWVTPLLHYGAAIAVGLLVAAGFPSVAAASGVAYLAYCVYDAREAVLRALFAAAEQRSGHAVHGDEAED